MVHEFTPSKAQPKAPDHLKSDMTPVVSYTTRDS